MNATRNKLNWPDKGKFLVLGLGKSGLAAARLLLSEKRDVVVVDAQDGEILDERAGLLKREGAEVCLGTDDLPQSDFALAIASPGVPTDSKLMQQVYARRIDVVSEMELGWSRLDAKVAAVTGSNGKSTAVKWLGEIFECAGRKVAVGGNYGRPVSAIALAETAVDWLVVEASSFQLETIRDFRAEVAILLNLLPNHLDRHGDMDAYRKAKMRIFENAVQGDTCVIPHTLDSAKAKVDHFGKWVTFGASRDADWFFECGCVWHSGDMDDKIANTEESGRGPALDLRGSYFDNCILGPSAAAVAAACDSCGVELDAAEKVARSFEPLPHRMQHAGEIGGVVFIDDSKATNLAAMRAALEMVESPVRLIAGGRAKESDFESLIVALDGKVERVYLIGEAARVMGSAWQGTVDCVWSADLEEATERALNDAVPGETVLLAPGCASFDQFVGYGERGDFFTKTIKDLANKTRI